MNPAHFDIALSQGSIRGHNRMDLRFATHAAGDLVLPTGAIVACDPAISEDNPPFARRVLPGRYPVSLSVAHIGVDQRVAFAMIRFAEGSVAKWEPAVLEGADDAMRRLGREYSYGVDSGEDCFTDAMGWRRLLEGYEQNDKKLISDFEEQHRRSYVDTWSWASVVLDPASGANIITFKAGYGDGDYESYFGLGASREPVCLVTDFNVIKTWTDPKKPHKPFWRFWEVAREDLRWPPKKPWWKFW